MRLTIKLTYYNLIILLNKKVISNNVKQHARNKYITFILFYHKNKYWLQSKKCTFLNIQNAQLIIIVGNNQNMNDFMRNTIHMCSKIFLIL